MRLLTLVWLGAALGALRALLWVRAPRAIVAGFYVALGWLGAVIYALRRPDPVPGWFGYHEVFHSFVLVACVCHFVVISGLAHAARP